MIQFEIFLFAIHFPTDSLFLNLSQNEMLFLKANETVQTDLYFQNY